MAEHKIKMRTRMQDNEVELQVLITHPMETGLRTDKNTKKKIPPHFIEVMSFFLNGKEVATANLGTAVSKDPLIGIKLKSAKPGDKIKVTWSDNQGQSGTGETTVKAD